MSLTVKHLIDKYSKITENVDINDDKLESTESINNTTILEDSNNTDIKNEPIANLEQQDIQFQLDSYKLTEEENKVLAALNMGIVTEKVLKARRQSRREKC